MFLFICGSLDLLSIHSISDGNSRMCRVYKILSDCLRFVFSVAIRSTTMDNGNKEVATSNNIRTDVVTRIKKSAIYQSGEY